MGGKGDIIGDKQLEITGPFNEIQQEIQGNMCNVTRRLSCSNSSGDGNQRNLS